MSNPAIGHGTIFNLISGSTTTPINGVKSVAFGSLKVDSLDKTAMGDAGTSRSYIPGLEAPGDVSVKLNYLPGDTSQTVLFATVNDGLTHNFSVVYPGATVTESFTAFVTSWTKNVPDDKLMEIDVKLQIATAHTLV